LNGGSQFHTMKCSTTERMCQRLPDGRTRCSCRRSRIPLPPKVGSFLRGF
jgi:hypothetical protein